LPITNNLADRIAITNGEIQISKSSSSVKDSLTFLHNDNLIKDKIEDLRPVDDNNDQLTFKFNLKSSKNSKFISKQLRATEDLHRNIIDWI